MTWNSHTIGQTFRSTGSFLTKHIWVWPIIGITLLTLIGLLVHSSIVTTMKSSLRSELKTLLEVETAMLETWLAAQESNAESMANNINVRMLTLEMLGEEPIMAIQSNASLVPKVVNENGKSKLDVHTQFSKLLAPSLSAHDYTGFVLFDRNGKVVTASESELVGRDDIRSYKDWQAKVVDGNPTVSRPFLSVASILDSTGETRTDVPTMLVAAPVRDNNFQVVAVLALRIRPEKEFTRILQLGRIGESGETYAFDKRGLMISNSRFDEDLILLGLIPDEEDAKSLLRIQIRDPGGNMTEGFRPAIRRTEQPLTRMAEKASAGKSDVDVEGYNDYRGVPVVGAWSWLPEYGFGVTTEEDVAEAYRPLTILKRAFWGLLALLMATSVAIVIFSVIVARLERKAREAAIEAKQLGQYKLEEKLGEGAMGVVYRGKHAMLRRPTAIKLINADNVTERSIEGFEREVQITSQLNHPNTIAIYDYGRTPEGIFYYAMEYLDGIELQDLVKEYGPLEPARIIYIVRQICDSLYEAHTHGLVHRDVKPANIMINRRGGKSDVVKVLDFGLVQARDNLSGGTGLAGTPLYMSPESIQSPSSVDACSDIYAVGGVAYFLATGRPMFLANSPRAVCNMQISEIPTPPSDIIEGFPADLEAVILSCLEKDRSRRPQTAKDLAKQLLDCQDAGDWDSDAAETWWGRHDRQLNSMRLPNPSDSGPASAGTSDDLANQPVSSLGSADVSQSIANFSLESDEDGVSEDLTDFSINPDAEDSNE